LDPVLDPETRTLGVRYDLDNPDQKLRPGMFATVTLQVPIAQTPAFRDRIAQSNPQTGHRKGLNIHPTVAEQEICPVTTAKLGSMGDPISVEVEGRTLWTCCGACLPKLQREPAKYLARFEPAPEDGVLAVPESAVIDTGSRRIVYVETEPGVFEGREVVLGPLSGTLYPVLDGLEPGEAVAAAGAFLLDAETRLKTTTSGSAHTHDPGSDDETETKSTQDPKDSRPRGPSQGPMHNHTQKPASADELRNSNPSRPAKPGTVRPRAPSPGAVVPRAALAPSPTHRH
jgi:Cu(I)/Ag(I) efflux system membrane fusion protein